MFLEPFSLSSAIPHSGALAASIGEAVEREAKDADLVRRIGDGDEAAFNVIYERTNGPVFRFLLRMSADRAVAEEALQETFLELILGPRRIATVSTGGRSEQATLPLCCLAATGGDSRGFTGGRTRPVRTSRSSRTSPSLARRR